MVWSMVTSADFRGSTAATTQKFIDAINKTDASLVLLVGDFCTSLSACPGGYDPAGVKSKISASKTVYTLAGNHEGGTCSGCEDNVIKMFNGVQFALIGCGDDSECTTSPNAFNFGLINDSIPAFVAMHTNFFNGCVGSHSDKPTIRAKIDAKPSVVGGVCGHNHQVSVGGPTGKIYVQESSPTGSPSLYCSTGTGVGTMGYWLFDDSVAGKLTVSYAHLNVNTTATSFINPTVWLKTITYIGGTGTDKCIGGSCIDNCFGLDLYSQTCDSGTGNCIQGVLKQANAPQCAISTVGCVGCDLGTNYCILNTCIQKKHVYYVGAAALGGLILLKILSSRDWMRR